MNKEKAGFVAHGGIFPLVQNILHVHQKVHNRYFFTVLLTSLLKHFNSPKILFLFCKPIQQIYIICAVLKTALHLQ